MDMDPLLLAHNALLRADFRDHLQRSADLARAQSRSIGDVHARIDYLEQRLAAIEAYLNIKPPEPPPPLINPTEDQLVSALEKLETQSPDPLPPQNDPNGLT